MKFTDCDKKIEQSDIKEFNMSTNINIPLALEQHYLICNGGTPDNTYFFYEKEGISYQIADFIPLKTDNEEVWNLKKTYSHYVNKGLPQDLLPFANDWGSNKFCIHLENHAIYIVYMDLGEISEDNGSIRKISNSFQEFIDNLQESDDEEE